MKAGIRQWPADSTEALVALLDERIADENDPEQRSRLERLRDALGELSGDVLRGVLTDWPRQLPDILIR